MRPKSAISTPRIKRVDEHPDHFYLEVPPSSPVFFKLYLPMAEQTHYGDEPLHLSCVKVEKQCPVKCTLTSLY